MKKRNQILWLRDVETTFCNFEGRERDMNPEGVRNFCVFIDDLDLADSLANDGLNVKWEKLSPKEATERAPRPFIKVNVSYRFSAPTVIAYYGKYIADDGAAHYKKCMYLDEKTIKKLDRWQLEQMDVGIELSPYSFNGRSGLSAYLHELRAVRQDSPFDADYICDQEIADEVDTDYSDMPFDM